MKPSLRSRIPSVRPTGIAKAMGLRVGGGGGREEGNVWVLQIASIIHLISPSAPSSIHPPPFWLACWLADKLYRPAYLQQHGIIQSVGVHSRWDMGV